MTPKPMTLSHILKAARKQHGWSLEELAERSNISHNTLKRTLDDPENVPLSRLDRLCKVLKVGIRLELGDV